jgi:cardiolipin synthase
MRGKDIPNIITVLRIILTVPIVYLLFSARFSEALVLFFVAGVSDALDGYLAKRNGWTSRLGSILDPVADKLLLISSFLALGWLGLLPLWLIIAVLARDFVIISGAVSYHLLVGEYDMAPTLTSKINTFLQIILVLTVVFSHGLISLAPWLIDSLVYVVMFMTVASGADYVWTWGQSAVREYRNKAQ